MQAYGIHRLEHTYMFTLYGAETPNYIQKKGAKFGNCCSTRTENLSAMLS